MSSILNGLDTVQQTLATQQFGLSITQRNVANANDPNYTRQEVVYTGEEEEWLRSGVPGVTLKATRNEYIDLAICRENQSLVQNSVASDALRSIDSIFNGNGKDLQEALANFFNSFATLSSSPADPTMSARLKVLSSAEALTAEIGRLYAGVQQVQLSQDRAVTYAVDEVNAITSQIAELNAKIQVAQAARSEDEFTLRDSRQKLVEELSGFIDCSYYETESGAFTITTRQGGLLVMDDESHALSATHSTGVFQSILLNGADITDSIEGGKLGGLIDMRDNKIAGYLSALDDLAATIISRVNEQHAEGNDLNGDSGQDFFAPFIPLIAGSNTGAAQSMTVAITDPRLIAAAGEDGEAGDNANAKLLAAISNEKLFSSETATAGQFYSKLIYRIGSDESTAEENIKTQNSVLNRLKSQRDSFSGVNLDEEAVSIIKFQKAYQASSRFATVLDALSEEILQLVGA